MPSTLEKISQPKFIEIPDDRRVITVGGFQKQLFCIDEGGSVSLWDMEFQSKLKRYENTLAENFREMSIGK